MARHNPCGSVEGVQWRGPQGTKSKNLPGKQEESGCEVSMLSVDCGSISHTEMLAKKNFFTIIQYKLLNFLNLD